MEKGIPFLNWITMITTSPSDWIGRNWSLSFLRLMENHDHPLFCGLPKNDHDYPQGLQAFHVWGMTWPTAKEEDDYARRAPSCAMLCHVMPHMLCHAMLWHVISYYVILCHVMSCDVKSCYVTCHAMSCCTMSCHVRLSYVVLNHAILCYVM